MRWITVARFSMLHEAHLARARLESEGIPVLLADEHTLTLQNFYLDALGGLRLQVPEDHRAQAETILDEDRSNLLQEDETLGSGRRCVKCGSRALTSELHAAPLAFLRALFNPGNTALWQREWRCGDCGMTMPDESERP